MSRFHHQSNVLNHIKVIFLCSCSSLFCSPDIGQEKGTKLNFSIAVSIERSRNCARFCAFRHLLFENQSIFDHNINRSFYSCSLLIASFQILWAIIGWKTFSGVIFWRPLKPLGPVHLWRHNGKDHRPRNRIAAQTKLTPPSWLFQNGCSQSSRFLTAGQRERGSGNEIGAQSAHSWKSLKWTAHDDTSA